MRGTTAPATMKDDTTPWVASRQMVLLATLMGVVTLACGGQPEPDFTPELGHQVQASTDDDQVQAADDDDDDDRRRPGPPSRQSIGVALDIEDGVGTPLRVRRGQTIHINQIDIRASVAASQDEGIHGLRTTGDFAGLGWGGVRMAEQEFELLAGPEGYKRRRFYRGAAWMEVNSHFTIQQVDARGRATGPTLRLDAGSDDKRRDSDDFFVRRMRAIQWTYDCASLTHCDGASNYLEEALVELRNARTSCKRKTLTLSPNTTALRVRWSLRPSAPYIIPIEQVSNPTYAYGFSIDVEPLTAPRPNGTYAPGTAVTFRLTLRDGAGQRLHPQGSLPTYNEVVFGPNEAGLQYYRAFFEPTATYYRRKHRERMLMTQIIGPAQRIQPIRSIIDLDAFMGPNDVQTAALPERDGLFSQVQTFPPANDMFGGAFDPTHAGWHAPVSDSWTYEIPANAEPGTYLVTVKGRRVYLGEDIPFTRTIEIQVGTPQRTTAPLTTGPCNTCHSEGGELDTVLHANDNRGACAGCHAPLGFELENPIFVRVHFIHSRSGRFDEATNKCSTCHLSKQSIQRTSKAACFSCHQGFSSRRAERMHDELTSIYVGGGPESFQQCTSSCHTTHPKSGF